MLHVLHEHRLRKLPDVRGAEELSSGRERQLVIVGGDPFVEGAVDWRCRGEDGLEDAGDGGREGGGGAVRSGRGRP